MTPGVRREFVWGSEKYLRTIILADRDVGSVTSRKYLDGEIALEPEVASTVDLPDTTHSDSFGNLEWLKVFPIIYTF